MSSFNSALPVSVQSELRNKVHTINLQGHKIIYQLFANLLCKIIFVL